MPAAKYRLERKSFKLLFGVGKKIFSPDFNLTYLKNGGYDNGKIGFVVSSALSKKSVVRNRLKRRARAIIFKHLKDFVGSFAAVFVFKKRCLNFSFGELEKEMVASLKKAGIIK